MSQIKLLFDIGYEDNNIKTIYDEVNKYFEDIAKVELTFKENCATCLLTYNTYSREQLSELFKSKPLIIPRKNKTTNKIKIQIFENGEIIKIRTSNKNIKDHINKIVMSARSREKVEYNTSIPKYIDDIFYDSVRWMKIQYIGPLEEIDYLFWRQEPILWFYLNIGLNHISYVDLHSFCHKKNMKARVHISRNYSIISISRHKGRIRNFMQNIFNISYLVKTDIKIKVGLIVNDLMFRPAQIRYFYIVTKHIIDYVNSYDSIKLYAFINTYYRLIKEFLLVLSKKYSKILVYSITYDMTTIYFTIYFEEPLDRYEYDINIEVKNCILFVTNYMSAKVPLECGRGTACGWVNCKYNHKIKKNMSIDYRQ